MVKSLLCGILLNLVTIFSTNIGQTVLSPVSGPSVSPSIWETTDLSPLTSRRYNRFEPQTLPGWLCEEAHTFLKTPYRWGGSLLTGKGTDCSGFVQYLFREADIYLPRVSAAQAKEGSVAAYSMDFSRLEAGDLLFFRSKKRRIAHVGIYLGEAKMIHAARGSQGVTVSDLNRSYYQKNFVVAKRLFSTPDLPRRQTENFYRARN
ncbi:MAG: C40 family peptidase [Deltaproteobacteria bacterium]|nr:C40 family peptidase [Deltaproteobacteria bacterium]